MVITFSSFFFVFSSNDKEHLSVIRLSSVILSAKKTEKKNKNTFILLQLFAMNIFPSS